MSEISEMVVRSQADLFEVWERLVAAGPPSRPMLSLQFIDVEGRLLPQLLELDDLPDELSTCEALDFAAAFKAIVEDLSPGGSLAALLHRPGETALTGLEHGWARELARAMQAFGVRWWPLHVSDDAGHRAVVADDLGAARSS